MGATHQKMSFLNPCPIYSINPFLSYHRYYSEILMRDGYMKALLVIKEQVLLSQVPPISEEKKRDDAISFPSFCSEGSRGGGELFLLCQTEQ